MNALEIAQRYAWNCRHAEAIAAAFAEGGTYSDPTGGWVFMESPLPTM